MTSYLLPEKPVRVDMDMDMVLKQDSNCVKFDVEVLEMDSYSVCFIVQ